MQPADLAPITAALDGEATCGRDAAELLEAVLTVLRRYVILPSEAELHAIAVWVLHSHAINGAHATPYLVVLSPEKRAGKTRLLEVLELLAANPWRAISASEAAMFRKIAAEQPTLLLDEVDAIFGSNAERTEPLRAVINGGNRRGASIARCVTRGKTIEAVDFPVFGPKVLAGIDTGRLPDTILDRGIVIRMKRRTAAEPVARFRHRKAKADVAGLVDELAQWADAHSEQLLDAEPDLPDALDDRAAEAWEALLAIADHAGGEWPDRARRAALALSGDRDEDSGHGARILAGVRAAFNGHDARSSADLVEAINADDELPFGGWREGKGLDARLLARQLRPYGIKPQVLRIADKTPRGYRREQFTEAWTRYLDATEPPHDNGDVAPVAHVADLAGGRGTADDGLEDLGPEQPLDDYAADAQPAPRCACDHPLAAPDEDGDLHCRRCGRSTGGRWS